MLKGPKHLWEWRACLGYSPAPGATLKRPCAVLAFLLECATNTVGTGDCYQRESSHVTFRLRSKTADALPTHITINTPDNQVPCISVTRPNSLIAYRPTPHYRAKPAKNKLHPLISWPLSGGRREPVSFLIYLLK